MDDRTCVGPLKECRKCGDVLTLDAFVRDKQRRDGRYPYCKPCHKANVKGWTVANTEKVRARAAASRAKRDANAELRQRYLIRERASTRARRYGITTLDLLAMYEAQGNRCKICGTPGAVDDPKAPQSQRLHIDHCHETGVVRGLVCFPCNVGLGNFRDDPELLSKAIDYLQATHDRQRHG